jgi:hypothetical protein
MTLKDIDLNEDQQKALKDKLDAWMLAERKKIEAELTEKYEQMEAELKEEYEDLVEEIKANMKKVYTKRFTSALKEMYEEIRAEVMVESLNSPEAKALEEVKAVVYPLINESTAKRHRDEFTKLASMFESNLEELELLKGANKKAQLMESLSPEVRKVVDKLLGEGTEEQIVEKFAAIKSALKEEVSAKEEDTLKEEKRTLNEDTEDTDEEEVVAESEIEDEEEETVEESVDPEFEKMLNEQLVLAGLRKAR